METTYFEEKQYMRQWWLLLLLSALSGLFVWALVQQLVFKKPFGENPAPDFGLVVLALLVLGLNVLFFVTQLNTKITDKGIYYRLFPFHLKHRLIAASDIEKIYVRKYKPLAEYGGWGIKGGSGGLAYNVSGNMGIQIVLKNGKKILVGTGNADKATEAVAVFSEKLA